MAQMHTFCLRKLRSCKGSTEITQFPLAIYCMFLVVLLPVINLVALIVSGCTVYLATNDLVAKAATQASFSQALNAMAVEAYSFQSNSLARFVKMQPFGGYTGCGNDLFVVATDTGGAGTQTSSANDTLKTTLDTQKYIYEMQVISSYTVSPLIDMSSFPLLSNIPGLGQPIKMSFAATRPIEHPGGMQDLNQTNVEAQILQFARNTSVSSSNQNLQSDSIWRTPDIFQKIQNQGQTVVSVNVVIVQANSESWTASNVSIAPNQKVWIDTQSVGKWQLSPSDATVDANGNGKLYYSNLAASISSGALIGRIGNNTPFLLGDTSFNLAPAGSGVFSLINNDIPGFFNDNTGAQLVRVIVTQ